MMSQQGGEMSFIDAAIKESKSSENTDPEGKNANREEAHHGDYQSVQGGVDLKAASELFEQHVVKYCKLGAKVLEQVKKRIDKWQKEMMNEDLDMMTEDCDVMSEESDSMTEEMDMIMKEIYMMMEKNTRDCKMVLKKDIEQLKKAISGYEQRKLQLKEDESMSEREQKLFEFQKKWMGLLTLELKRADESLLQQAENKRKSEERSQKWIQLKKRLNDKQLMQQEVDRVLREQRDYDALDESEKMKLDNEEKMKELTDQKEADDNSMLEQKRLADLEQEEAEVQKVAKEWNDLTKTYGYI